MTQRLAFPVLTAALLALSSMASVSAATVFGNLGSTGTNTVGSFNGDTGPGVNFLVAQGFSAASPNLSIDSVSMWLFGDPANATLGIYADNSGVPAASPLYTSNQLSVGAKDLYTFSFTGADLANGTNYWISPVNSNVSWYLASGAPTQQNGSGYTFTSAKENTGSGWVNSSTNTWSISVSAVPEPSSLAIAGVGIAIAGITAVRRRRIAG